ncbi:MAG: radical SAM protein, partial [Clostridia bacterium]
GAAFSELLGKLDRLNVPRIRFMTSHPKDLSDELIDCFASLKHLTGQLHLPVQSGSDRILSLMNRRYTREKYLSLTEKLRKARPDVGLTSDIIVGFPGETMAEFEETLSLAEKVRFDAAFTFIYSPRIGTKAALLEDNTPAEEKSARIQRLIEAQQRISAEVLSEQIGARQRVLVEAPSTRDEENICGKSDRGFMVNFPGNTDLIGKFVEVKITSAGRNTLRGERVPEQEER